MEKQNFVSLIKTYWSRITVLKRILWIIFLLIYLVFPQFLVIPLAIYLFYIVSAKMPRWLHVLSSLTIFIFIYAIAVLIFVGFLWVTTDVDEEDEYTYTALELSETEEKYYKKMIGELDFYQIDPLLTDDDHIFKLIGLMGYRRGYWFNRAPLDSPTILLIPYELNQGEEDLFIEINYETDIKSFSYSFKDKFKNIITLSPEEDVISVNIVIRNFADEVIYTFDSILIYQDRLENPYPMDYGGQYDPHPIKTIILNNIGIHIATIFMIFSTYLFDRKYQKFLNKK